MINSCKDSSITITIPIYYGTQNRNGVILTKEALEKSLLNLKMPLPIIFRDDKNNCDGVVVGETDISGYDIVHKPEQCMYLLTVDGSICHSGVSGYYDAFNEEIKTPSDLTITSIDICAN